MTELSRDDSGVVRWRPLAVVGLLVMVAAGCGARVTPEQRASTLPGATAAAASSPESAAGAGSPGSAGVSGSSSGDAGSTPSAAGTGPGAADAGSAPVVAAGGGGATDIGVTDREVLLGNVSTLSGPVPGLFQGAVVGAIAVVAHQNAQGGVAGRRIRLETVDDQFDSGQNRSLTIGQLDRVFAFLGSFSVVDDAAAREIAASGIPDLSYALNDARRGVPNNLSVQPAHSGGWQLGYFNWYKAKYPQAIKAVGGVYIDIPAAKRVYLDAKAAAESLGYEFVYERGIQPTETDFTADVIRMRQAGVKMVVSPLDGKGAARLAKAFQQQSFEPEVFVGMAAYDQAYLTLAGSAAEGTSVPLVFSLFQGEDQIDEVRLMKTWIQKVKPGYRPDLYAALSWAQGRLLFRAMEMAGPGLTRRKVLDAVRTIGTFDANGLIAPANPSTKAPPTCFIVASVVNGRYVRTDPAEGFICNMGGFFRS